MIKWRILSREMIPDYLCGPRVIINLLIRGRVRVREENVMREEEVGAIKEGPQAKECGHL